MKVRINKEGLLGTELNASERKVIKREMQKQMAENTQEHIIEIDAIILWILHEKFGFGPKRLRKFYDSIEESMQELIKYYSMEDEDATWLCSYRLKNIGVDIEEWYNENNNKTNCNK